MTCPNTANRCATPACARVWIKGSDVEKGAGAIKLETLKARLAAEQVVNFYESPADLRRRQDQTEEARALLEDVWEAAERGPYPLLHADALNVLAQIERDAGNTEAAVKAAPRA